MEFEAEYWFSRHRNGDVLVVLTSGDYLEWSDIRDNALPPSLRTRLRSPPLWIDISKRRSEMLRSGSDRKLRSELTEDLHQLILSFYPDRTWSQLHGEERSQRNRALRLVLCISLSLALAAGIAIWKAIEANKQQHIAISRELVSASLLKQNSDPELSLMLAMYAVQETWPLGQLVLPEAELRLHSAVQAFDLRLRLPGGGAAVAWSPDGKRLAGAGASNPNGQNKAAKIWDAQTGKPLLTISGSNKVSVVAWSPDGSRLATGLDNCEGPTIWDTATGKELVSFREPPNDWGLRNPWISECGTTGVAWSPNGRRIATSHIYGMVRVWDLPTGKQILSWQAYYTMAHSIAWSPDGTRLASSGDNGGGRLDEMSVVDPSVVDPSRDIAANIWDAATGRLILSLKGQSDEIVRVAWSPNGSRLATGSHDGTARVWNSESGKLEADFGPYGDSRLGHNQVSDLAWSHDGSYLAIAADVVRIQPGFSDEVNPAAGVSLPTGSVKGLSWNPDGSRLATANDDGTVAVWNAAPGGELFAALGRVQFSSLAFAPDGRYLAATTGGSSELPHSIQVWEVETGRLMLSLDHHVSDVAEWSRDGRLAFRHDDRVEFWEATARHLPATPSTCDVGIADWYPGLDWSPDGKRLFTIKTVGGWTAGRHEFVNVAQVWNVETCAPILGPFTNVLNISWGPDGKKLAMAIEPTHAAPYLSVRLQNLSSDKVLTFKDQFNPVWSPEGNRLATVSDTKGMNHVTIWDAESGNPLTAVAIPDRTQSSGDYKVAFAPNGRWLATGRSQTTVSDAASGKQLLIVSGGMAPSTQAWSSDGKRLAIQRNESEQRRTVEVWNVERVKKLLMIADPYFRGWSPDGQKLATANDSEAHVWDANSGSQLVTVARSTDDASLPLFAWSQDSKVLAIATGDMVRVYVLDIRHLMAIARQRITRPMTESECSTYLHVARCPPISELAR
jgi:WD40 repeat protein